MRIIVFAAILAMGVSSLVFHAPATDAGPTSPGTISPQHAEEHVGEVVTVEGVAYVHQKRPATFLDMGGDYPFQAFQAVVFSDQLGAFGDLAQFDGRTVDVTGRVKMYNGKPEIILTAMNQIKAR